jgi:hypothetical protein
MGSRKHRSKRECVTGKPRQAAENPLGAIGRVHQFIIHFPNANSAERSKFLRLCYRQNIKVKFEECRTGKDDKGKPIDIPMRVSISGIVEGLRVIQQFVDSSLHFHSEILIASAIPHIAAGQGELSEAAKRFGKLNRHQKRESLKDSAHLRKAEAASRAMKAAAEELNAFGRAVAYESFLQSLPLDERERMESRNKADAEAREAAPQAAPFHPLNGAPKPRTDCGILPPIPDTPLTVLSADALTFGLKDWYQTIVDCRRAEYDRKRLEQF